MRWLSLIGAGIHFLANLFLGALLCLSLVLIVVLWREGEIPVPPALVEELDRSLAKEGFRLETGEIQIDVRGMVLARDIQLFSSENSEAFFDAESAYFRVSLWSLLLGQLSLTEVAIAEGRFYCPAVVSPAGQREAIVENISVDLIGRGGEWGIDRFIFETLNARVQLTGSAFTPLPGMEDTKPADADQPVDFVGAYIEVCQSLLELKEPLEMLDDPILRIHVDGKRQGPLHFTAHLFNEGLEDPPNQLKLGAGSAHVRATLGADGILRADGAGRVWLEGISWTDEVSTGYTEATIELDNGLQGFARLPLSAELYCYTIEAWGLPFDGAFALINLRELREDSSGEIVGQARLKSDSDWLAVSGRFQPSNQSAKLKLEAEWNPEFFLGSTAISPEDIPQGLDVIGQPRWRAWVDFAPGFKPEHTRFDVRFGKISYQDIHLLGASLQGSLTDQVIDIAAVDLTAEDYRLEGNYWQRFDTGDYRFQVIGSIWPQVLNAIIKEDWWTRLWSDIQFQDVAPDAAIDMSGQYGGGAKKQKIYGSATLNQVIYRGEKVERAFARIWQTPKTLDLFEFSLQNKEGGANVGLHWEYLPNRERNFLSFEARTSMPLEQVARFAAPEVLEYAEMFPTQTTPTLDMVGLIYGETTPNAGDVYFKTSAFFPGAFEFEDIRFANGSFECLLTPDRLDVNNGRFSLGEGRATLAAHLPRAGPELEVQSARIGIADAKLWGLYEAIPFLRESRAKQEQIEARELQTAKGPAPNKPFKEQYAGDVTVWMDARGKPSDLGTFVGNGALSIKNANLGELHLLGGLSKLLANMGIPLGTLKFSNAQSDFTLARSNLFFPDVEITGQTGLINANGNFNIEKETLDFMVTLRPFGNVRAPVLAQIATVFSPVSDLLEVELTGTLHDPEYQVTIQPFSLFTGQRKVANPNADVPAVIPTPVPLDHPQ